MKKSVITILWIIALGWVLSWCSMPQSNNNITSSITLSWWTSGTETIDTNSITRDFWTTGSLSISGNIVISWNKIAQKENSSYSFFEQVWIMIPSSPLYWEYYYNSLQKSETLTLHNTAIASVSQNTITISKHPLTSQPTNKCLSFKDNMEGKVLSFHQDQKTVEWIKVDTIWSKIRFEFDNTKNDNQFWMICFTKWDYQYEIWITRFSEEETQKIISSLNLK